MPANSNNRAAPWTALQNELRSRRPESCAIYGTGANVRAFLKTLGRDGVRGTATHRYPAKHHVVMMENDLETVSFYQRQLQGIQGEKIILVLENAEASGFLGADVRTVCIIDATATLFWQHHPATPNEKIAFLGDAPILRALLCKGLCLNLYATVQCITYHIWSTPDFCKTGVEQIAMDQVIFHQRPWQEELAVLLGMNRIVLCLAETETMQALEMLRALPNCPPIYIRNGKSLPISFGNRLPQMISFGDAETILSREIVLGEALLPEAKALNAYYRKQYGGDDWARLSSFKQMSSISSAHYFPVLRRLYQAGMSLEALSELEHIRWCRFHYLQGWKHGKKRDDAHKIHDCLVPYAHLTEEEKQKDRNNVKLAINGFH